MRLKSALKPPQGFLSGGGEAGLLKRMTPPRSALLLQALPLTLVAYDVGKQLFSNYEGAF